MPNSVKTMRQATDPLPQIPRKINPNRQHMTAKMLLNALGKHKKNIGKVGIVFPVEQRYVRFKVDPDKIKSLKKKLEQLSKSSKNVLISHNDIKKHLTENKNSTKLKFYKKGSNGKQNVEHTAPGINNHTKNVIMAGIVERRDNSLSRNNKQKKLKELYNSGTNSTNIIKARLFNPETGNYTTFYHVTSIKKNPAYQHQQKEGEPEYAEVGAPMNKEGNEGNEGIEGIYESPETVSGRVLLSRSQAHQSPIQRQEEGVYSTLSLPVGRQKILNTRKLKYSTAASAALETPESAYDRLSSSEQPIPLTKNQSGTQQHTSNLEASKSSVSKAPITSYSEGNSSPNTTQVNLPASAPAPKKDVTQQPEEVKPYENVRTLITPKIRTDADDFFTKHKNEITGRNVVDLQTIDGLKNNENYKYLKPTQKIELLELYKTKTLPNDQLLMSHLNNLIDEEKKRVPSPYVYMIRIPGVSEQPLTQQHLRRSSLPARLQRQGSITTAEKAATATAPASSPVAPASVIKPMSAPVAPASAQGATYVNLPETAPAPEAAPAPATATVTATAPAPAPVTATATAPAAPSAAAPVPTPAPVKQGVDVIKYTQNVPEKRSTFQEQEAEISKLLIPGSTKIKKNINDVPSYGYNLNLYEYLDMLYTHLSSRHEKENDKVRKNLLKYQLDLRKLFLGGDSNIKRIQLFDKDNKNPIIAYVNINGEPNWWENSKQRGGTRKITHKSNKHSQTHKKLMKKAQKTRKMRKNFDKTRKILY